MIRLPCWTHDIDNVRDRQTVTDVERRDQRRVAYRALVDRYWRGGLRRAH